MAAVSRLSGGFPRGDRGFAPWLEFFSRRLYGHPDQECEEAVTLDSPYGPLCFFKAPKRPPQFRLTHPNSLTLLKRRNRH